MIFWKITVSFISFICVLVPGVFSIVISKDPSMREGESSFIYCDVGSITSNVVVYTRPLILKATCLGPGNPCVSTDYPGTVQSTTGVTLNITSVDTARETGDWYCVHNSTQSNDMTLNDKTIGGNLIQNGFTNAGPSTPVNEYIATMVLSCIDTNPTYQFNFTANGSSSVSVPGEVIMRKRTTHGGTTCEDGNNFYEIELKASNSLDVFDNTKDVTFIFTYYGNTVTAAFSVDFLELIIIEDQSDEPAEAAASGSVSGLLLLFMIILCVLILKEIQTAKSVLHLIIVLLAMICILVGLICIITVNARDCPLTVTNCLVNLIMAIVALLLGIVGLLFSRYFREYGHEGVKNVPILKYFQGRAPVVDMEMERNGKPGNPEGNKTAKQTQKEDKSGVESKKTKTRPLPAPTTQQTRNMPAPKPALTPSDSKELKELRNVTRPGLPSPRVGHTDDKDESDQRTSSASSVTPQV